MEKADSEFPSIERMEELQKKWDDLRHYMETKGFNELEISSAKSMTK